jgi:hypothetical protein
MGSWITLDTGVGSHMLSITMEEALPEDVEALARAVCRCGWTSTISSHGQSWAIIELRQKFDRHLQSFPSHSTDRLRRETSASASTTSTSD